MDQPDKAANPARGQLNKENKYFPVPALAGEFGLARGIWQSRPALTCSFSILSQAESGAYSRDPSRFPRRRPFIYLNRHTSSGQSRVNRVTQFRIDGNRCRESADTEPVNLKAVRVTGAAFAGLTLGQLMCASLFPTPTIGTKWAC